MVAVHAHIPVPTTVLQHAEAIVRELVLRLAKVVLDALEAVRVDAVRLVWEDAAERVRNRAKDARDVLEAVLVLVGRHVTEAVKEQIHNSILIGRIKAKGFKRLCRTKNILLR